MPYKSAFIFVFLFLTWASAVSASVCDDVAKQIRANKREIPYEKWPGVEHEALMPTAYGKADVGLGGKPGSYIQPVLQAQKKRLLAEAERHDADHLDLWKAYLASSGTELNGLENQRGPPMAYRLKSAGLVRLEQSAPASLLPYFVAYYYQDAQRLAHIVRRDVVPGGVDEADYYGYYQQMHFIGINDVPVELFESALGDDSKTIEVWQWQESKFKRQCDIQLRYDFGFKALTNNDLTHQSLLERHLVAHADVWGRAFRAHQNSLDHYYDKWRAVQRTNKPGEMPKLQSLYDEAKVAADKADEIYQEDLLRAFANKCPAQAEDMRRLAINIKGSEDQILRPVLIEGHVYMAAIYQPYNGNGPLPWVDFDMYGLKAGKVVKLASIETQRYAGNLIELKIVASEL